MSKSLNRLLLLLIWTAGVLFLFHTFFGFARVDPHSIEWVYQGDTAGNQLGWYYFYKEPWVFPPGDVAGYGYPVSTNIVSSDTFTLLVFILKAFKPFKEEIQFYGIWILLNYFLQGFTGFRIVRKFGASPVQSTLFSWLIILTPAFLFRTTIHVALSSHWLILLGLSMLGTRPDPKKESGWILLALLSALTEPYIWAMVMIIFVFQKLAFDRASIRPLIAAGLKVGLPVIAVWGLIGMIGRSDASAVGIGAFSARLSSLFIAHTKGSYEPYAYLGYGGFLLLFMGIIAAVLGRKRTLHPHLPRIRDSLWFIAGAVFIASTFVIAWEDHVILNLFKLMRLTGMVHLLSIFRTTGRFIWIVNYSVLAFSAGWVFSALPNLSKKYRYGITASLALIVVLQYQDVASLHSGLKVPLPTVPSKLTEYPELNEICQSGKAHFFMFPSEYDIGWLRFAHDCNLTTSAPNSGRSPKGRDQILSEEYQRVKSGILRPDSIYVLKNEHAGPESKNSIQVGNDLILFSRRL